MRALPPRERHLATVPAPPWRPEDLDQTASELALLIGYLEDAARKTHA
jgi:hypothetical protein